MGMASNDVSHWSKYATRGAIINLVKRCEAVVIRLKQEIAALKEEGQESARINNHNVEVLSQQIAALKEALEQLADDKGSAYWTSEEVRKIAKQALRGEEVKDE